ncbi:MAG: hypothetical protein ACUVQ1_03955 [Candidatus Kapaibacteriales bacterium]
MVRKKIFLILLMLLGLPLSSFAGEVDFRVRTDTMQMLIGDQIHLFLESTASPSINVFFPQFKDSLGKFEIVSSTRIDTTFEGEKRKLFQTYTLTTFDTGFVVIPSLTLLYEKEEATGLIALRSDSIIISVVSVPIDTTQDIKDIKNIKDVPFSIWEYAPYFVGILLLVGFAYLVYNIIKKIKRKKETKPELKIPPHIWAFEELKRLDTEKLWQQGRVKEYHIRLTEILRTYIERQMSIPANEMVSSEIIQAISARSDVSNDLAKKTKNLLEISDLVKFAKYIPLPDENTLCFKIAWEFVDSTKPTQTAEVVQSQTTDDEKK